ncbi:MAG TPA: xanthine dehydrogenase family protein subunit M [Firmicutes bacterium]|nr:xanthine dehydrogenase family protein subunit M [Bacillota bacterium]
MYLPDFEYFSPDSVEEACQLLSKYGSKAKAIAGGTDVLVKMKSDLLAPEVLIGLGQLSPLKKIEYVPGKGVVIGSGVTHNEVRDSKVIQEKYMSVSQAAHHMANNQVRNRGTIGGNISNAVPSADMPPILISLGATATIVGTKGERTLPLEDVFAGPNVTVLEQDEIITEFVIPDGNFTGSTYMKFGLRASGALAVVGVAAAVQVEDGVIKDARIVLGAVSPTPVRAKKAESFLKDKQASEELFAEAGVIASGECKPISDIRASAEYRKDMVRVFTKRALDAAVNKGHV